MNEILENQEYILRRVRFNTWSGIKQFNHTNEDIGPDLDAQGLPVTGLSEDSFKLDEQKRKVQVKGTRKQMEEELGLEPDTLRKGSLFKPSEFWINFAVRVGGDDLKLNSAIPDDKLKIYFLMAQGAVAFGLKNRKAKSEYVIFTKEDEATQSNNNKKSKRVAFRLFDELSLEDKKEILEMAKGIKTASLTVDVIEDKLSDFLEDKPAQFVAMANDPTRKQKTYVRNCLSHGFLSMEGDVVMYGDKVLGYDVTSAANALFSDEHAKTREAIKIKIADSNK